MASTTCRAYTDPIGYVISNQAKKPITFAIAQRRIGYDTPPYVIAELSGNHNGELSRALRLIDVAAEAGVDAVKLQTYRADTITIDHDGPGFRIDEGLWEGRTLYELYEEAHTPWEWHPALFDHARSLGLAIFSSPFDETAIDFLETLDVPAYKIASFEAIDIGLIMAAARTGKPLIISTGLANLDEIEQAITAARNSGDGGVALLHCVSGYPTPVGEANLATISDMAARFEANVGLSDHTMSTAVPVAAVALGAVIIEKHITLARADGGPDAEFSLEPDELAQLVTQVHDAWQARGEVGYSRKPSEAAMLPFRRSLYVVADVAEGEIFDNNNVRSIRPGLGLPPRELPQILGRRASRDLARGTPLAHGDIDE